MWSGLTQAAGKDEVRGGEVSLRWEKGTETRGRVRVGAGPVMERKGEGARDFRDDGGSLAV